MGIQRARHVFSGSCPADHKELPETYKQVLIMRKNLINAAIVSCLLAFAGTAAAAGQQGGQGDGRMSRHLPDGRSIRSRG
jgi:hypothetical protein